MEKALVAAMRGARSPSSPSPACERNRRASGFALNCGPTRSAAAELCPAAAADRSELHSHGVWRRRGRRSPRIDPHRLSRPRRRERVLRRHPRRGRRIGRASAPPIRAAIWPCCRSTQMTSRRSPWATPPACGKGRSCSTLGNPHAIARDGRASAGWGIVVEPCAEGPAFARRLRRHRTANPAPLRHADRNRREAERRLKWRAAVEPEGGDGWAVRGLHGGRAARVPPDTRSPSMRHSAWRWPR